MATESISPTPDAGPTAEPRPTNQMLIRLLSAAVLVALILLALTTGVIPTSIVLGTLVMVGTAEFYLITRRMGRPAAPWVLFPLTLVLLFRFQVGHAGALWVPAAITAAITLGLVVFIFSPSPVDAMSRWAMGIGGALYIGWSLGFYLAFYTAHDPDPGRYGFAWLLVLAGSTVMGDTAAMLVGTRFGRSRFFPAISPKKSREGAIGGFVAQALSFALLAPLVDIPLVHGLVLGGLVAIAAQAGDLVESQFKRAAGVKDASTWVPGHGGLLDRMDSLMLIPGVAYYYVTVVLHVALPK